MLFLTCILTCYPVSVLICLRLNLSTVRNLSLPLSYSAHWRLLWQLRYINRHLPYQIITPSFFVTASFWHLFVCEQDWTKSFKSLQVIFNLVGLWPTVMWKPTKCWVWFYKKMVECKLFWISVIVCYINTYWLLSSRFVRWLVHCWLQQHYVLCYAVWFLNLFFSFTFNFSFSNYFLVLVSF